MCYPTITPQNKRIDEKAIPELISCINKMNKGAGYMQLVSDSLLNDDGIS